MKWMLAKAAAAAGLLVVTGAACAATVTTTFQVTATVLSNCSVNATAMAFGNYDTLSGTPTDQSSTVTVQCSLSTGYTIGLDVGLGSGATVATRKMSNGGSTLNYSVYQDSGRSQLWGTSGADLVPGTGSGVNQNHTVYGRIPNGQAIVPGNYSDTLTVSVNF